MALDPNLMQKLQQLAKCSPEVLAEQLTKLASADPEAWRQAINTLILTMWVKNMSTHRLAADTRRGLQEFQDMLKTIAGVAPGAQEPAFTQPPGMPGRPAAPQVAGPIPGGPGVNAAGVRVASDGTPITNPEQLAAEAALDVAFGMAPGAAPMPGRPGGPLPTRPRNGRDHSVGPDGMPLNAEQQEAESILDAATGQG
jgi:hypothetical protein